jgi:hypothetical protein
MSFKIPFLRTVLILVAVNSPGLLQAKEIEIKELENKQLKVQSDIAIDNSVTIDVPGINFENRIDLIIDGQLYQSLSTIGSSKYLTPHCQFAFVSRDKIENAKGSSFRISRAVNYLTHDVWSGKRSVVILSLAASDETPNFRLAEIKCARTTQQQPRPRKISAKEIAEWLKPAFSIE